MEIKENIYISFVMAGKLEPEDKDYLQRINEVKPCCGRNWWCWKPTYKKTNIGFDISWLCFLFSYDNYNKITQRYNEEQKQAQNEIKDTL